MMSYAGEGIAIRRQQTFAITPNFYPESKDHPKTFYNEFSRLNVAIIGDSSDNANSAGKKPSVTCNVPLQRVPDIIRVSGYLLDKNSEISESGSESKGETSEAGSESKNLSPAYTVKLKVGDATTRGKTPAEAIQATPKDHASLQKLYTTFKGQLEFLRKSTDSRFASANKAQEQAILDAMDMMQKNTFDETKVSKSKYPIYEGMTFGPNELKDKDNRPTGLYKYTKITISMEMGEKTPVVVTITNGKAPKDPNTGLVDTKNMKDKKTLTMRLYAYEWTYVIRQVDSLMSRFEENSYRTAEILATREAVMNPETQWRAMQSLKSQYASLFYSDAQMSATVYSGIYKALFGFSPDRTRILVRKQDLYDIMPVYDRKMFDVIVQSLRQDNIGITYYSASMFRDQEPKQKAEYVVNLDALGKYMSA